MYFGMVPDLVDKNGVTLRGWSNIVVINNRNTKETVCDDWLIPSKGLQTLHSFIHWLDTYIQAHTKAHHFGTTLQHFTPALCTVPVFAPNSGPLL